MSTALKGTTAAIAASSENSSLAEIVQAFATLLTVTTPSDSTAANVVAVTATIRKRAQDEAAISELVNSVEQGNPEFQVHLQDVVTFIEHLHIPSATKDIAHTRTDFAKFIHHQDVELANRPVREMDPVHFKLLVPKSLTKTLANRKLSKNSENLHTVDTTNAVKWLGVFLDLRSLLDQLIMNGTKQVDSPWNGSGKKKRKQTVLMASKANEFLSIIEALYYVVECKPLVKALQSGYRNSEYFLSSSRPETVQYTDEDDSIVNPDSGESILEDDTYPSRGFPELGIVHAFRYYRTFTAWTHAVVVVTHRITKFASHHLEFHLASPADFEIQPAIPQLAAEDVAAFIDEFPDVREDTPFEKVSVNGNGFEKIVGTVHCEAQLMGLIDLKMRSGHGLKSKLSAMLPDGPHDIPIGVGNKCCFMCHRLASCLAQTGRTSFVLPGTHGVIYGWVAPPHIEVDILKSLHSDLHKLFMNRFPKNDIPSHKSSPASVASSIEDEFMPFVFD
ncbi:hypothetical protein CYLTODRAFT_488476 [Cylindrobasidium torrendii FP15055 ss-10]|uniref:Uncharacterized protein n=1 Tax=Cylindrobasidium torrendii FP15055 ss-10 TaxID=1314674 RepID=A0A0D7BHP1_9AGAR|nr:hypothetical protein CYLTODRAFT_488476 [Cylindrobasidium torrendii FP15055 ss-10]